MVKPTEYLTQRIDMYIDKSRIHDIEKLKSKLDDSAIPTKQKRGYFRIYKTVMTQLKDKKLARLREQLFKCLVDGNQREIWKAQARIKDYLKEDIVEEGAM